VRIIENKVQVSGQVAVMAINGLLTRVIFDANPDHEFYVEESFPLDWMYPYLTPFGVIMKINRNPVPELTEEILQRDHQFWADFSERLTGNIISNETPVSAICEFAERVYLHRNYDGFKGDRKFVRDNDAQKAFSKLRSSIAGVLAWRVSNAKTPTEQQRMFREAEFAFKQAYAFCPYSPEAIFRYINLLIGAQRVEEALMLARTSHQLDPFNGQLDNLVSELQRIKSSQGGLMPPPTPGGTPQIAALEARWRANPADLPAAQQLVTTYMQAQQQPKAAEVLDQIMASPAADGGSLLFVAQMYHQMNQIPKVEDALTKLVKVAPDNPEAWFDLAGLQAMANKETQAMISLGEALDRSAKRMARDPNALNLYSNALTDQRFAVLRQKPEFQKVLEKGKVAPK
jgi:thioredoxin-like negative regulator of GroEL